MAIVRFFKIAELMGNTQANESAFRRFRDYAAKQLQRVAVEEKSS